MFMHTIGIDMSKRSFHAAFDTSSVALFANSAEGVGSFLDALQARGMTPASTAIGVEATGAYHLLFCARLTNAGWRVVVLNPLESHRFALSQSIRTVKNDRKDATLIRQMVGLGRGYPYYETEDTIALKALIRERQGLVLMLTTIKERAEAHAVKQSAVTGTLHDGSAAIAQAIRREIHVIGRRLERYAPETQQLLRSIPGVGSVTAATLVAFVGTVERFSTPEKLVAYIGLDCRVFESGSSVKGKGYISKRGNGLLRRTLWNAAFIARQRNPELRAYFEKKIVEGKPYAVALCAVERKLIHLIFAVWKRGTPFVEPCAVPAKDSSAL